MPTYSFQCRQCGHDFDELVLRFNETAPCPKCGSGDVERRISAPAARTGARLRERWGRSSSCGPPGLGFG